MSRPLNAVALSMSAVAAILLTGAVAGADGPGDNTTTVAPGPQPTITAVVTLPPTGEDGTPGSVVATVPCSWSPVPATMEEAETINGVYEVIEIIIEVVVGGDFVVHLTFYSEDGILHRYDDASGRYEYQVVADCTDATDPAGWSTGDIDWWEASDPDPGILLPGARREATKPIGPPQPDLSPSTSGVVNLGMWLAVAPAGPISVEARLGPDVWARTTATMTETSFDPGNGDPATTCEGNGTPIPPSAVESVEEGPCGYTYRSPVDGGAITITSRWVVTWELSDGRTGADAPIEVTTVVPYDVDEIQTVGTGN